MSRRDSLFVVSLLLLAFLVGCTAPTPQVIEVEKQIIVEKPVVQTVMVEKERVVEKAVVQMVQIE